ncbi:hypothetical protein GCM10029992_52100 [Glycomyces albus]
MDAAIPLGAPGSGPVVLQLPRMYGSRIYFVREDKLDFYVNPGPALVEPALHNEVDSNFGKIVSFCEFTFNDVQLFINVSYVDLVTALPIGIRLQGDGDHRVARSRPGRSRPSPPNWPSRPRPTGSRGTGWSCATAADRSCASCRRRTSWPLTSAGPTCRSPGTGSPTSTRYGTATGART